MVSLNKRILLTGATGLVGKELGISLVKAGYQIHVLTQNISSAKYLPYPAHLFSWQEGYGVPAEALAGVETIINLAGEPIATGRWSKKKKIRIVESRFLTTRSLVEACKGSTVKQLIQASAIGYYGPSALKDHTTFFTEQSNPGAGFLPETALQWEDPLTALPEGIRRVTMRLGVVLGETGGALDEIIKPYTLGVGMVVGSGHQYMSWIHIEDLCRFVVEAIANDTYAGAYNLTAPQPMTMRELHSHLKKYYSGWDSLKVPSLVLKIILGEKAQIITDSSRTAPQRLLDQGFTFKYSDISSCITAILGEKKEPSSHLVFRQWVPCKREEVWSFFADEKNLEKITPPWLNFRIKNMSTKKIEKGSLINYKLKIHQLPIAWRTEISQYQEPDFFQDIQLKGPYKKWHHTHLFSNLGEGTLIEDKIDFQVPLGHIGRLLALQYVTNDVKKIFSYRMKVIEKYLCAES